MADHIHPIFHTLLQRKDKEQLLGQRSFVVWMTGLSGSGKSTLARALENRLYERGCMTKLLDGDNLRSGVNNNLGFSDEDRFENVRRAAAVSRLFIDAGVITICSLISPTKEVRDMAREMIGEADFYEIYVNCPFDVCAKRDVKGLYAKALRGEIKNFTGLDSPYEVPETPFLELRTDQKDLETCLEELFQVISPLLPETSKQK